MSIATLAALTLGLPLLQPGQEAPANDQAGVWIDFRQGEEPHGLQFVDGFQGSRQLTEIDGVGCAQTTPPGGMYLLFEATRDMIRADRDTLTFEVEVYDGDPHPFMLEVESTTPTIATGGNAYRVISTIQRGGTPKWRWVRWQVTDPAFCDAARDAIRFRFYDEAWWNDGRLLSISQVRVTHQALVFRPQQDAALWGARLPVTLEGYDKEGKPLADGTEVRLACRPRTSLAECPQSVKLAGGKAEFEVQAGQLPGTASIYGLAPGGGTWVGRPIFVLAGAGKLEERTDLVTGEQLAATARFDSPILADSQIGTFTDDQGQVALRATCSWKPEVTAPTDTRLVLDVPIAGVPRRFCVYVGCPDQSVDCVWARIKDRTGELFSYHLEPRAEGHALVGWLEACLECRATAGPSYSETGGTADGVIDLPCSLYALDLVPMQGFREAEIDVWGVETDVLAPPPGAAGTPGEQGKP
jgi:hypothetical protein